ncbi:hypothetical protein ANCCAN_30331, partial [Ancylostoma caninum]
GKIVTPQLNWYFCRCTTPDVAVTTPTSTAVVTTYRKVLDGLGGCRLRRKGQRSAQEVSKFHAKCSHPRTSSLMTEMRSRIDRRKRMIAVVWAKTNLVGCGFARCRDVQGLLGRGHRNIFVCHYNPQGNTVFVTGSGQLYAVPAFTWATGNKGRCSDCPPSAPACFQGLCYMPTEQQYSTQNVTEPSADVL